MSIGWLLITFILGKLDQLGTKLIYLISFSVMFVSSNVILIGVNVIYIIPIVVFFMGTSFGTTYTKDVVIMQEQSPHNKLGSMMSLYTLFKTIGSTTGSIIATTIFALKIPFLNYGIQNIMLYISVITIILFITWLLLYKEKPQAN